MIFKVGEVNRRFAAVIGVSSLIFGGEGVNRRFAAVIGVSSLIFEGEGVNRRSAAAIGGSGVPLFWCPPLHFFNFYCSAALLSRAPP